MPSQIFNTGAAISPLAHSVVGDDGRLAFVRKSTLGMEPDEEVEPAQLKILDRTLKAGLQAAKKDKNKDTSLWIVPVRDRKGLAVNNETIMPAETLTGTEARLLEPDQEVTEAFQQVAEPENEFALEQFSLARLFAAVFTPVQRDEPEMPGLAETALDGARAFAKMELGGPRHAMAAMELMVLAPVKDEPKSTPHVIRYLTDRMALIDYLYGSAKKKFKETSKPRANALLQFAPRKNFLKALIKAPALSPPAKN